MFTIIFQQHQKAETWSLRESGPSTPVPGQSSFSDVEADASWEETRLCPAGTSSYVKGRCGRRMNTSHHVLIMYSSCTHHVLIMYSSCHVARQGRSQYQWTDFSRGVSVVQYKQCNAKISQAFKNVLNWYYSKTLLYQFLGQLQWILIDTLDTNSSTAQGGGGSFKNRKL